MLNSKLTINVLGDLDEFHLDVRGSPKKVSIEPVKNEPEIVKLSGNYRKRHVYEIIKELDIDEKKSHLAFSEMTEVLYSGGRKKVLYLLNLLSNVEEVTVRTLGKVGKLMLRVCKSVSVVVIRLFGRVKKAVINGIDFFKTKIVFKQHKKEMVKKTITKALKTVVTVVSTVGAGLKIFEFLKTSGIFNVISRDNIT